MNTRTTGSAGPKNRGLTLLTFLLSSRWNSFVMNTHTIRQCRQPNIAVCAAVFLYFVPDGVV